MPITENDISWLSIALGMGFASRQIGLPPMIGFLVAGFINHGLGMDIPAAVESWADFGLTLMLFCIGLKLRPSTLLAPRVWGVALLHMILSMLFLGGLLATLAAMGAPLFVDLNLTAGLIIAFSLTFSSTVLAIKTLEDAAELTSAHGKLSIGVLVMQDIAAVLFLGISKGQVPSPWAGTLLLLIPFQGLFMWLLEQVGHGELLVVFGFLLALGGAALFEMLKVKGDLGSLLLGSLLAPHPKAAELKHHLVQFQDLFLVGFFVQVGEQGLSGTAIGIGIVLALMLPIKGIFWQLLFQGTRMKPRTAFTTATSLFSYSEFALIVVNYAVKLEMCDAQWISTIAVALTFSFVIAALCDSHLPFIFAKTEKLLNKCNRSRALPLITTDNALPSVVVVGLGTLGRSVLEAMRDRHGLRLIGLDFDAVRVQNAEDMRGVRALLSDASDPEQWTRFGPAAEGVFLILTTTANAEETRRIADALKTVGYEGMLASMYKDLQPHEAAAFQAATGSTAVFDVDQEAGVGFVEHVCEHIVWPEAIEHTISTYEAARQTALEDIRRKSAMPGTEHAARATRGSMWARASSRVVPEEGSYSSSDEEREAKSVQFNFGNVREVLERKKNLERKPTFHNAIGIFGSPGVARESVSNAFAGILRAGRVRGGSTESSTDAAARRLRAGSGGAVRGSPGSDISPLVPTVAVPTPSGSPGEVHSRPLRLVPSSLPSSLHQEPPVPPIAPPAAELLAGLVAGLPVTGRHGRAREEVEIESKHPGVEVVLEEVVQEAVLP